ncbi:Pyruvate/2-oxoglutarate dehydrogenase complex, dihydrolipoamide dehydrogenase (E3) component [Micromonospora pattaloongensis]|uniref:Pyruvate/2-oxoglutarate dehydrogenase complex, dihydrolipoamide dehydrogenase (E3) component n=1 Tax=Micromonospora pattaloongensis TaxID=405436 RepID=A0A1H3IBN0_9ACTN|nr:NAD(P)/FAD-dependent oxidoreductase [Micromonospora pattaloongensis]SDY24932.1 Pyruvate/2-oxoglutarate dehydrogenase complex, dihydrolipoamide dehydrogenase (E3) component [Micromonospora pattaloongensis]
MNGFEPVDVVVVGLGVGGEEVAGKLAEAGQSVVAVERNLVGGECPYWGCVPSKMMIRAAATLAEARRVDRLAGQARVRPDWAPVAARIREEATDSWDDTVAVDRLTGKGARFVRGAATLVGPGRVRVDGQGFDARRGIVLATGTSAAIPPIDGLAGTPYWTNREAIEATTLPESLIVLGGGAIGLELAQVYARFGARVTVIEAADRLLSAEEPESSAVVDAALRADGIEVCTGAAAERIDHDGGRFTVRLAGGASLIGERLLVAVGRRARLGELGLETVGLDPGAQTVSVDERMRAGDGIWAVGDVTGSGAFTHVAMYQAGIAVRDILGQEGPGADYRALPRVTFTDPEIGAVGLTERQARDRGLRVRTGCAELGARGWIHQADGAVFVKLVVDADRGVLVGATSAGPAGGEVLGALVVAVHGEVPVEKLRHMIYAYPTFHRGIEDALRALT